MARSYTRVKTDDNASHSRADPGVLSRPAMAQAGTGADVRSDRWFVSSNEVCTVSENDLVRRLRQFQADEPGFPPLFSRAAAEIESLRTRLAEHEANARAYEEIIGKKTYREVADELASARKALEPFAEIAKELTDGLKNSEKNTLHWAVPTVGELRAALAALKEIS